MDVEAGEGGHSKGRLEDIYLGSRHVVRFSALSCRGCRERDLIFTLSFYSPRTKTAWHSTSTEETWQGQLIRPVELVIARARVLTAPLSALSIFPSSATADGFLKDLNLSQGDYNLGVTLSKIGFRACLP